MNSMLLPYFGRLARAKSPAVPKSLAPIKAAAVPAETVPVVPVTTRPAGATQTPRGWGADKTMPKQIIAKQKITTGFICKAQKTGFSHKKLRGLLKKDRWSTYDADWIGSDDKCTVSPPLYIRFGMANIWSRVQQKWCRTEIIIWSTQKQRWDEGEEQKIGSWNQTWIETLD